MRVEVGKVTPKSEMDNGCIFMTSHMTLSTVPNSVKRSASARPWRDYGSNIGLY